MFARNPKRQLGCLFLFAVSAVAVPGFVFSNSGEGVSPDSSSTSNVDIAANSEVDSQPYLSDGGALRSEEKKRRIDTRAGNAAINNSPGASGNAAVTFRPRSDYPMNLSREELIVLEGMGNQGSAGSSPLADGGATPAGGPCVCDSDCATTVNDCERTICTETLGGSQQTGSGVWTCFVEDRPVDDPCDLDGLYCTADRCDGGGTCVAAKTLALGGGTPITPCSYACSATSSNAGFSCEKDSDCTAGACEPRANSAALGVSVCNEALDRCEIDNGGGALGRCCVADNCTIDTEANCIGLTGNWLRLTDPRDLNLCECPKYSAGIAPVTTNFGPNPLLTTTGVNRICSIDRNPCTNAILDCRSACDVGPDLGKQCLTSSDCDQIGGTSTCTVQTCDVDFNVCDSGIDRIGDDYAIANGSYLRLLELRFRGGVASNDDAVVIEIWDGDPSVIPTCSDGSGVGTCNLDGVGAPCNVVGFPPTSAGTCIGPRRIENAVWAVGFDHKGTDDYRLIVDCEGNCFPNTTIADSPRNTALSDPIIIPPTGYITFRALNVVNEVSGDLQEVSQFHLVQASSVPDVGSTDPDSMFVNGVVVNYLGAGNNIMAIELVGTKVPNPMASCCDPALPQGLNCTETDRQNCRYCVSHNDPTKSTIDFFGQRCNGTRECGGYDTGGSCRDTNWKGQRKPLSDPPAQLCISDICDVGACCNDLDGTCIELPVSLCAGPNQTPGALGSNCSPNCCSQPNMTAGNCCADTAYCSDGSGVDVCIFGAPGGLCGNICDADGSACVTPGTACGPNSAGICGGVCRDCVGAADTGINVPVSLFHCSNNLSEACDPVMLGADCSDQTGPPTCDFGSVRVTATFSGVAPEPAWRCSISGDKCFSDRFGECYVCTGDGSTACDPTDPGSCSGPGGICDTSTKGVCEPGGYCDTTGAYCSGTVPCAGTCLPPAVSFDFMRGDACVPSRQDPGWYHKVTINGPAAITWDLCCSNPLRTPAWIVMMKGCDVPSAISPIPNCSGVPLRFKTDYGGFGATSFDGGSNESSVVCADQNMSLTFDVAGAKCSIDKSDCFVNDPEACDSGASGTCNLGASYVYGILIQSTCSNSTQVCLTANDCPTGDTCEDNFGSYQAHVTVEKLIEAACCTNAGTNGPGATCSIRTEIECEEISGDWLGDLPGGLVVDCVASPCATGSCCLGPGSCDDLSGAGIGPAACSAIDPVNAVFHGGIFCESDPCPVCIIQDQSNCQEGLDQIAWVSDRFNFGRVADDFRPLSAAINRACWTFTWSDACELPNSTPPDDDWEIVIYADDNGLPDEAGNVQAPQTFATSDSTLTLDGIGNNGDSGFLVWTYTGTFVAAVIPDDCYWIEITGKGGQGCTSFWMSTGQIDATGTHNASSPEGNNYAVSDLDGVYDSSDIFNGDYQFCLDSGIAKDTTPGVDGGCGPPTICCCPPGGGFIDGITAEACQWDRDKLGYVVPGLCNGGAACPAVPANDVCGVADIDVNSFCPTELPPQGHNRGTCTGNPNRFCTVTPDDCPSGEGPCVVWPGCVYECTGMPVDNRTATRDGDLSTGPPSPQGLSCFSSNSPTSFQADTWYEFVSPCSGEVEARTNNGPTYFDTMIEVHDECNCANIDGPGGTRIICADEGCEDLVDGISIGGPSLIQWSAIDSTCYKLRVGGFAPSNSSLSGDNTAASRGQAQLDLIFLCICDEGIGGPFQATGYPHEAPKNRYVSFTPNPSLIGLPHGYEVEHVASGNSFYISAPRTTPASVVGLGITDLVASPLPPLFDFGAEPIIHVTGCMIAPDESYIVYAVDAAGVRSATGLFVSTVAKPAVRFWADVVGAFSAGGDGTSTPPTPPNSWKPPDGIMSGSDIIAITQAANMDPTAPHLTWADIAPEIPDGVVNGVDIVQANNAFANMPYPYTSPANCWPPTFAPGACCTDDVALGPCAVTTAANCATLSNGQYQGDNTACAQFTCSCDINNNSIPDTSEILCANCAAMEPGSVDMLAVGSEFKIVFLDSSIPDLTLSGLADAGAAIGRSDPFEEGDLEDDGALIPNGGLAPYPNTSAIAPDPCVYPVGFPEDSSFGQEVHLEILSLNLTNGTQSVRAGQAFFDSVFAAGNASLYQNSFGEAQGQCIDFPAEAFFNLHVEIDTGTQLLYNKTPIVLRANVSSLPPDLQNPAEDFFNDPSFPGVSLFDAVGVHVAYVVSASFGGQGLAGLPPASCETQPAVQSLVSFCVDDASIGTTIKLPNDVQSDVPTGVHTVTVYRSSGDPLPAPGPDTSNARYPELAGSKGVGEFAASDRITSLSYGRDGTVNPVSELQTPILFFSVDRDSVGEACTDVNVESGKLQVAADIFTGSTIDFGAYESSFAPACGDTLGNCLVTDQSTLGLAPIGGQAFRDNVTGIEAELFVPGDRGYATFNFPGNGATIWRFDGIGTFGPTNLSIFATGPNMGLQAGDEIDALVLSDETPGADPQEPNGLLNPSLDEVLFSLTPNSPSVMSGAFSAADVLHSSFDNTLPTVRNSAASLGLLMSDNIDALDISPGSGVDDCNGNGVNDACDIDLGVSPDLDGSGFPDECEGRNRYIVFVPSELPSPDGPGTSTAYRVSLTGGGSGSGVVGWVGVPFDGSCVDDQGNTLPGSPPCTDQWVSRVVQNRVDRVWTESVIYVGDCEIVPVARYDIEASATSNPSVISSETYVASTVRKPGSRFWADVVGTFTGPTGNPPNVWTLPNGTVNGFDVTAILKKASPVIGDLSSINAAHFTYLDLSGQVPDNFINGNDVLQAVNAFAEGSGREFYPFPNPLDPACQP